MTSIIPVLPFTITNFTLSAGLKTYELDGQQHDVIAMCSHARISHLQLELKAAQIVKPMVIFSTASHLLFFRMVMPHIKIMGLALNAHIIDPQLESLRDVSPEWGERIDYVRTHLFNTCSIIETGFNCVLDYADPILMLVSLTAYVAMIAFGQPVIGITGLICLACIGLKRLGVLPTVIDQFLTFIMPFFLFYNIAMAPMHLLLKLHYLVIAGIMWCDNMAHQNRIYDLIVPFLPESPWKHHIDADHPISDNMPNAFQVNFSSVHVEEVAQQMPSDFMIHLQETTIQELYGAIQEKMRSQGIVFNQFEQQGWDHLEQAILHQKYINQMPSNPEELTQTVKGILWQFAHEQDTDNFQSKLREFALIGNSCSEGWWRDCAFFLMPISKDNVAWNVHYQLSKFRGSLIQDTIIQILGDQSPLPKEINEVLQAVVGGSNNIHLHNSIHQALRPRWRSHQAELYTHIQGESLVLRLLSQNARMRTLKENELSLEGVFSEIYYHNCDISQLLPVPIMFTPIMDLFHNNLQEAYNSEQIVQRIHDAIAPQMRAPDKGVADVYREIPWEPVASWLATLENKGVNICDEGGAFLQRWVTSDDFENYSLTKEGVQLLLWDLGVLEPAG